MKKRYLIIAILIVIVCSFSIFVACDNNSDNLPYSDWAFDGMKSEVVEKTNDEQIRIMSYNILVHIKGWGGIPVKPRAQMFAQVLAHHNPDVVALQEVCSDWYKYLTPQIEDTYAFIQPKFNSLHENRSPIIYNKNKFELLESDLHKYSYCQQNYCRVVTTAVFKQKSNNKIFAVTSTHWDLGMEDKKVAMRTSQVAELSKIVNDLYEKYHCPIFAAGDYNSVEYKVEDASESYNKFVNDANVVDIKFISGTKDYASVGVDFFEESVDHIFLKGNATVGSFNILSSKFYDELSDHRPIFADVTIY